jgi:hypothetical protein
MKERGMFDVLQAVVLWVCLEPNFAVEAARSFLYGIQSEE